MKVNIYDFDKTIYDGDSGYDFYKYMLRRRPFLVFPNVLKSIPTGIKILFKVYIKMRACCKFIYGSFFY